MIMSRERRKKKIERERERVSTAKSEMISKRIHKQKRERDGRDERESNPTF